MPTEMRFAANGTFLGSTPITGAATSPFVSTGGVLPGSAVVMSDLPAGVQSAIRSQIGNGRLNQLTQIQGTNGLMYAVSYDSNGRPMVMTIGPDGRVISNNPIAATGSAAASAAASGRASAAAASGPGPAASPVPQAAAPAAGSASATAAATED